MDCDKNFQGSVNQSLKPGLVPFKTNDVKKEMDSIDIQKQNYWISKVVLLLSQFLESCFELTAKLREQDPFRSCENHKHPVDYYTKSQSITFLGLSPVFFL